MWGNDKDRDEVPARSPKATNTVDTLIGRQTVITGDVAFTGGLHVDGRVKGKVMAESDKNAVLSVSESGAIEGDVRVPHIVLNGSIEGDVHADQRITLSAKAKVTGNVYYRLIEMTSGAMVNGQMVHEGATEDKVAPLPDHGSEDASDTEEHSRAAGTLFDAAREKKTSL